MDMALRPMSISQVLDRTFFLYRNNFVLFAGIAIVTPALRLIVMLAQLKAFGPLVMPTQPENVTPQFLQALLIRVIISVVAVSIVSIVGTAIASSATAHAVSMVHLGKSTTIAESYRRVKSILGRVLWLTCRVLGFTFGPLILSYAVLAGVGIGLVLLLKGGNAPGALTFVLIIVTFLGFASILGALVWSLYALCRYSLAVPACTLEDLPAGSAMRRSSFLSDGTKWGILGIILLTGLMGVVLTYALQLPALLASSAVIITGKTNLSIAATIWIYLAEFIGGTVAGPIATIALVLVYYDQRVRKEAFDLQMMMDALGQAVPQQAAAAPPPMMG